MNYETIIGLEIHVQLKTKSKLFCASPNNPDVETPNTNICEICTGQPGTLPVLNKEALQKAILVGLALDCETAKYTKFDRKNYFYPDLPKGYQISQFDQPINGRGQLRVGERTIGITRAHLEEDAGKLVHGKGDKSYVDFNRTGVPLLEIVTEPDFRDPAEVGEFLTTLQRIVRYLDASDADMEKGQLRVDANISLRKQGETELPNYKVEVKNMNSFKAVEQALNYEVKRQAEMLEKGQQPKDETRGFVDDKKITVSQRTKEQAHDYRYFPEPDLPQIEIKDDLVQQLKAQLPELPHHKAERFTQEYNLDKSDTEQLVDNKELADFFEHVISEIKAWTESEGLGQEEGNKLIKPAAKWVLNEFAPLLSRDQVQPKESKLTAENLAELLVLLHENKVSATAAKTIFAESYKEGTDPHEVMRAMNLEQVSDEGAIEQAVEKAIADNPDVVEKYKAGKTEVAGVLVGQVMREMAGRANPAMVNKIIKEKLG